MAGKTCYCPHCEVLVPHCFQKTSCPNTSNIHMGAGGTLSKKRAMFPTPPSEGKWYAQHVCKYHITLCCRWIYRERERERKRGRERERKRGREGGRKICILIHKRKLCSKWNVHNITNMLSSRYQIHFRPTLQMVLLVKFLHLIFQLLLHLLFGSRMG